MKMLAESQANIEVYDELQTIVKKRKLMWFCHISMASSKDNSTGPGERKMQKRYAEENVRSCYEKVGEDGFCKHGRTHGAPYCVRGYIPLRFGELGGGYVVMRMGTQQQQKLCKHI